MRPVPAVLLVGSLGLLGLVGLLWLVERSMTPFVDPADLAAWYGLDLELARAVERTARQQGADPRHLAALIHFETGGTWSPSVRSPDHQAVGLIQFRGSTAAKLGTTLNRLAGMTAIEQLDWVGRYLRRVALGQWDDGQSGPLDDLQAVAMAVFYPWARYQPPTQAFPSAVRENNPGITSPADYLRKLRNYAPRDAVIP